MESKSAGILLFRRDASALDVLLVHPGGPLWRSRDEGAWSIPKGEVGSDEEALESALREFCEELGTPLTGTIVADLGAVLQENGKTVQAWAAEGDFDPRKLRSNQFELEWPPASGRRALYPEVDRAEWFTLEAASKKIRVGQRPLLERLGRVLTLGSVE